MSDLKSALITKDDFGGPWPLWTKRAGARLLNIFFPNIPAKRWLLCFESKDPVEAGMALFEGGHIWGRMARLFVDLRKNDPQTFEMLSKNRWIKDIKLKDGKCEIAYGEGVFGMIVHHMEEVLEQPSESQTQFWNSFSKGFAKKLAFRRQDGKAIRIYLFLILTWPRVQQCTSIRELYNFVFRSIPPELCPEGVDPIDFEDRQFKWFETLCSRNLGLKLAKKGRPNP